MARSKSTPPAKAPDKRRKTIRIDQQKLDAAKRVLGVSTETAAVDAALDLVVFRGEVFEGLDRMRAGAAWIAGWQRLTPDTSAPGPDATEISPQAAADWTRGLTAAAEIRVIVVAEH